MSQLETASSSGTAKTQAVSGAKPAATATDASASGRQRTAAPPQIRLDESGLNTFYSNFCRVTGTPEELLIDFGLNTQPMATDGDRIALEQRVVMNFYTAKRLLSALHMAVQRHESIFGELETSIQKRVKSEASA